MENEEAVNEEQSEEVTEPQEQETAPEESATTEEAQQTEETETDTVEESGDEADKELKKITALRAERKKLEGDVEAKKQDSTAESEQDPDDPQKALDNYFSGKFDERFKEEKGKISDEVRKEVREEMKFDKNVTELQSKYDGKKDGLPKFDLDKVIKHGQAKGVFDLETAYRDMHQEKVIEAAVRKAKNSEHESSFVEPSKVGSGAQAAPGEEDITKENVTDVIKGMLKKGRESGE